MTTSFLLVTCCLEPSRAEILSQVIANLKQQAPDLALTLTVFDNASSEIGTVDALRDCFQNVYVSDHNVGYWSAIDWWLDMLADDPPEYTYIIESDMIHYAWDKLPQCADWLDKTPDAGSVRLHQYSVAERHLYNKDAPQKGSHRNIWQSHTNKVTGKPVELVKSIGDIWSTNFLTQLPALNRYKTMCEVFHELRKLTSFTEIDFQRMYWEKFQQTGIIDGGIFNADAACYGSKTVTGSWSSEEELARTGYKSTRFASITPQSQYNVIKA